MRVGAVVVTYNSARSIAACVRSLWGNGVTDVVVIDNASDDASAAVVDRLGAWRVQLSDNRGFATACNVGAYFLRSDAILFLNPDAQLLPGALSAAVSLLHRTQVGAVGLSLQSEEGVIERDSFGREVTFLELLRGRPPLPLPRTAQPVGWASGGALLVRTAAWRSVGGFDEQYFLYWEDIDLCRRLWQAGWQVWWQPGAMVQHERGGSGLRVDRKTVHYDVSADRYFKTHYAYPIWLAQRWLRRLHRWRSPQVR